MSKQITAAELAEIVTNLLTDPEGSGELATSEQFSRFMTDIANVVCDHCGGETRHPADAFIGPWLIGVHRNDSLPDNGGIWAKYDPEAA